MAHLYKYSSLGGTFPARRSTGYLSAERQCSSRANERASAVSLPEFGSGQNLFSGIGARRFRKARLSRSQESFGHRDKLLKLLDGFTLLRIDAEMKELAQHYIDGGIFLPTMADDALHVAASVLSRQDILLSWNFKHLVNRRRRALVNQLNTARGLPTIEIVAPPEI
jgi:hypothetical protein